MNKILSSIDPNLNNWLKSTKNEKKLIRLFVVLQNEDKKILIILPNKENKEPNALWNLPNCYFNNEKELLACLSEFSKKILGIELKVAHYVDRFETQENKSLNLIARTFGKKQETVNLVFFSPNIDQEIKLKSEIGTYKWLNLNQIQQTVTSTELVNSLKRMVLQIYPVFFSPGIGEIPRNAVLWERGVAIIQVSETDKFLVYDRFDKLLRFPGGKIDPGESALQAAIRESKEETGIKNLKFKRCLASSNKFYKRKAEIIHSLDHYFLFEIEIKDWQKKSLDEIGMRSILSNRKEILKSGWNQTEWILSLVE